MAKRLNAFLDPELPDPFEMGETSRAITKATKAFAKPKSQKALGVPKPPKVTKSAVTSGKTRRQRSPQTMADFVKQRNKKTLSNTTAF